MPLISLLLVDDNPKLLDILKDYLQDHYADEVLVAGIASDGQEAISLFPSLRPHIILLDLALPSLTGLDAIPRLRMMSPNVGIIVLTARSSDSYRQAALKAGADDCVFKSALSTDLLPAIRRIAKTNPPPLNKIPSIIM
jgi:DNA-binding response OmpR family regulator